MTISVGKYTFSAWLRRGIGTRVSQTDQLGGGAAGVLERATVPVDVALNGAGFTKNFALIGPGDIIGLNPHMIVRTEPRTWITDFEPNYLAFIEFFDEDFVWRYTPARPNGERLSPWLALLVLKEATSNGPGEFVFTGRQNPLRSIQVGAPAALPPLARNWVMAHVHINEGHVNPSDFEAFILSLEEPDSANGDRIISRLFSPRKLDPNTSYRGFLVPAFETGRLAGLGQGTATIDAQAPAWNGSAGVELPVYFEWHFRTGENEDFESLVKRLEPRPVDDRVGIRDMDGSTPGFGVTAGTDIGIIPPAGSTQTLIGLEGALRAPDTVSRPVTLDPAKPFLSQLQPLLNLNDDRKQVAQGPQDPVVTPPIYGGFHALKDRVDLLVAGWLSALNRDPRLRVSAGFGTRVIQRGQEDYVARAWAQVTAILEANKRMIRARLAMAQALSIQVTLFAKLAPTTLLAVARPLTKKVMGSPVTVHQLLMDGRTTGAPLDAAMRRLVRPRGATSRRLQGADPTFGQGRLIDDVNEGKATAAKPKELPAGLPNDAALADGLAIPGWQRLLLALRPWLVIALIVIGIILLLLALWAFAILAFVAAAAVWALTIRARRRQAAINAITDPMHIDEAIGGAPAAPGFVFVEIDPPDRPGALSVVTSQTSAGFTGKIVSFGTKTGAGDTVEGGNFRKAAVAIGHRLAIKPVTPVRPKVDLAGAAGKVASSMDPHWSWPHLVAGEIRFPFDPGWLLNHEHLVPAMAYPDFDDPMYEKLRDLSSELFLPNIGLIPPDTITLLRTNPPFIESYMVGLNHEFGRELLWREYPTDQRGSYFRQFWSVKGLVVPQTNLTPEQQKAMYRDIAPLDTWTTASELGHHPAPERPKTGDLVLTVRGELLKKYPNTLIYAQKAHLFKEPNGTPRPNHKPVIHEVTTKAEMDAEIRFPMFTAEVEPDIRFFGFDLTIPQAKGADHPAAENDDWGWYFIIAEIPGEPRFGMDIEFDPDDDSTTPISWNDLAWDNVSGAFVDPAVQPNAAIWNSLSAQLRAQWGSHSADLASILLQRPVMIAVHAREMLESFNA
jgi:hypothetical protein